MSRWVTPHDCAAKRPFPTFGVARTAARRANRASDRRFHAYACPGCRFYHVGTAPRRAPRPTIDEPVECPFPVKHARWVA